MLDPTFNFGNLINGYANKDQNEENGQNSALKNKTDKMADGFGLSDLASIFTGNQPHSHSGLGGLLEPFFKSGGLEMISGMAMQVLNGLGQDVANSSATGAASEKSGQIENNSFKLTLVRAMIQAAKADGEIDQRERDLIDAQINQYQLDDTVAEQLRAELDTGSDVDQLVQNAKTDQQKTELYIASRLATNPAEPKQRSFLEKLQARLNLPDGLLQQVEKSFVDLTNKQK